MNAAPTAGEVELSLPAKGPLVLAGPPTHVAGRLRLTNRAATRSRLRGFTVLARDITDQPAEGRLVARLDPAASTEVLASLELPRGTPPGDYPATLQVAGREVEAVLRVVAAPALDVTPSRVFVERGTSHLQLLLSNTGNQEVAFAPVARSTLTRDPDLAALPLLRDAGGRGTGGVDGGVETAGSDAVLRLAGPASLAPGDTAHVDAQVDVDAGLDPQRRYQALLPIGTATLRVVVNPVAARSAPPARKRAAAPSRRKNA